MRKRYEILVGDCRKVLAGMTAGSVQCMVTSPPYLGLRDYDLDDRGIGLESTLEEYLANMVAVFREVRRVLRGDGTLWLNMGDSYANDSKWGGSTGGKHAAGLHGNTGIGRQKVRTGLKPKDLIGMPWRLALALQSDGWWLRSDIIWHKPNCMTESGKCSPANVDRDGKMVNLDRPTKAHDYLFLLTKRARYYYDAEAVRERSTELPSGNVAPVLANERGRPGCHLARSVPYSPDGSGRNLRTVWTIPTEAFSGAHFATFPRRLVTPCIKAGTSKKGCCPKCGVGWQRVVKKERRITRPGATTKIKVPGGWDTGPGGHGSYHRDGRGEPEYREALEIGNRDPGRHVTDVRTVGWKPGCWCAAPATLHGAEMILPDVFSYPPIACTVLDPFMGSGTVGVVATQLGRRFIGIELNPDYAEMARRRIDNPEPEPEIPDVEGQMQMEFGA